MQCFVQEPRMKTKSLFVLAILILTACSPAASAPAPTATSTITPPTETFATISPTPDLGTENVWIPRAPLLTARSEMPALELNGLIYVPGGFGPVPGGLANGKGPVT